MSRIHCAQRNIKKLENILLILLLIATLLTLYGRLPTAPARRKLTAVIKCRHVGSALTRECEALRALGYTIVNSTRHAESIDILWTRNLPWTAPIKANMINIILETWPLHNKRQLLTAGNISVIKPAFIVPRQMEQLRAYVTSSKRTDFWIEKNLHHRGVKMTNVADILALQRNDVLVQEYLSAPLLISNRKFDLGMFGLVTSVSPLRLYLYTDDVMARFCTDDYLPFDPNVRGKYIEEDVIIKVWDIPALKDLVGDTPGEKKDIDIITEYLKNEGYDTSHLHQDIIAAATEVGCKREKKMADLVEKRERGVSSQKSFQLLRFDLAIQRDLSIWIIEINSSPATFKEDAHHSWYVKMLTRSMVMGGLVNSSWTTEKVAENTEVNTVTDAEINVDHEGCIKCSPDVCRTTWTCSVCSLCLTPENRQHFRTAVLEHRRRNGMTRAVPPPFRNQEAARKWMPTSDPLYQTLSWSTKLMALWYHRKCLTDAAWCS